MNNVFKPTNLCDTCSHQFKVLFLDNKELHHCSYLGTDLYGPVVKCTGWDSKTGLSFGFLSAIAWRLKEAGGGRIAGFITYQSRATC